MSAPIRCPGYFHIKGQRALSRYRIIYNYFCSVDEVGVIFDVVVHHQQQINFDTIDIFINLYVSLYLYTFI